MNPYHRRVSVRILTAGVLFAVTLAGCNLPYHKRPDDLVYVAVSHLPPDSKKLLFVAQLEGGLKQLDWYQSSFVGWGSGPKKDGLAYGEDESAPLKSEEALRYGVLIRNSRRQWRVWWFDHRDVLGIPPDSETGVARWRLDLNKSVGPESISDETLRWLGITSGLTRPRWIAVEETAHLTSKDGRMPGWMVTGDLAQYFQILDSATHLANAGALNDAAQKCVIVLDALEGDLRWYPMWTKAEGRGLEQAFDAFLDVDRAVLRSDQAAALESIRRLRDNLATLRGSDEPR